MTDIHAMEPETIQDATAPASLDERMSAARARLYALVLELATVDEELEGFLGERVRQQLLERACNALDELDEACGSELFWEGIAPASERAAHIARARSRGDAVRACIDAVEVRRNGLLKQIGEQNEHILVLEDEAFEHQEELERQHNEWIVERELESSRARPHLMLWMRGEEDRRSRKGLLIALCVWLVIAIVLPFISIPEKLAPQPEKLPERVVTVIPEQKKLEKAPPPPPELTRPERKVERKPTPTRTAKAEPKQMPTPQPAAKPQGILAFKDALSVVDDMPAVAQLGKAARLSNDTGEARPERAMLTGSAPGTSSGINLAAQSRGFGSNSGERGAIKGTALTRASSGINAIAAKDPATGSARRGGRSDEEIQVVFDRYKSALYRLYQRELRNDATLQGKVVLRLTIEPDGSVSMAQVKSSEMEAPALVADIVARVKGFNFGAKDVPAVTIVYPMNFLPAG
jgi:outer membrane biosynthesis protein TonB